MSSVGRRVQEDEVFPRRWTWWRVTAESRRHVFVAAGFVYEPPLHSSLGPCALLAPDTVPDSLSLALSDTYTLLQISFQASRRSVSQPVSSGLGVLLMSGAQSELGVCVQHIRMEMEMEMGIPLEGRSGSRGKLLVARTPSPPRARV